METLFLVIGLFLGAEEPDMKILKKYGNPQECHNKAGELNQMAKERQEPYRFFCRPVSLTVA